MSEQVTCVGLEAEPSIWIWCSGCYRRKEVKPSCDKRNCERCQKRRCSRLMRRYLEKMIEIDDNRDRSDWRHKWRWITLTGFRIPFDGRFRDRLIWFGNCAERFLKMEYPDGGIMVIEMTVHRKLFFLEQVQAGQYLIQKEGHMDMIDVAGNACLLRTAKEFYIHAHAVAYGERKIKEDFDLEWGQSLANQAKQFDTGLPAPEETRGETRFSWLETIRSVKKGLNYMLGYIAKSTSFDDVELEVLKRTKHVRTWGALYGKHDKKYDMICDFCGAKCYIAYWDGELPPDPGLERLVVRLEPVNDGG